MEEITFKEIRKYISTINPISVCNRETLKYENFACMVAVPKKYDKYNVVGIGLIESEFKMEDVNPLVYKTATPIGNIVFVPCIEIMISKKARTEWNHVSLSNSKTKRRNKNGIN